MSSYWQPTEYFGLEEKRQNELMHYGILGMKWGVRNYQYKDGSLTPEGKIHYYGKTENKKLIGNLNITKKVKVPKEIRESAEEYGRKNSKLINNATRIRIHMLLTDEDIGEYDPNDRSIIYYDKKYGKEELERISKEFKENEEAANELIKDYIDLSIKKLDSDSISDGKNYVDKVKSGDIDEELYNDYVYYDVYNSPGSIKDLHRYLDLDNGARYPYGSEKELRKITGVDFDGDSIENISVPAIKKHFLKSSLPSNFDSMSEGNKIKAINNFTSSVDIYDDNTADKHRRTQVADLGLKALNKMDNLGFYTQDEFKSLFNNTKKEELNNARQWFLYEDQTIGLPQIADLVNRGKTKDEIKAIIDDSEKVVSSYSKIIEKAYEKEKGNKKDEDASIYARVLNKYDADKNAWNLAYVKDNSGDTEKFIDACMEIKTAEKNAPKIRQMANNGLTYSEIADRLGVSKSTIADVLK